MDLGAAHMPATAKRVGTLGSYCPNKARSLALAGNPQQQQLTKLEGGTEKIPVLLLFLHLYVLLAFFRGISD